MEANHRKYLFGVFFVALAVIFIQRFSFKAIYQPVMDDWFLYGDIYQNKLTEFIIPNEKFAIRPMAGLIDIFIVSPLFRHLWIVEIILTIFLTIGIFLLIDTLQKNNFSVGGLFVLLLGSLPLNMEATYWLAAAIRISSSLFFVGLSSWLLNEFLLYGEKRFLAAYCITGFITVSFYEPAIAVYLLISCYLVFKSKKYKWILAITAVHIIYIAIYYLCNSSSMEMEARGHLLTSGFIGHTVKISAQALNVLTLLNWRVFISGFSRGIQLILKEKLFVQTFAILLYSIIFGVVSKFFVKENQTFEWKKFIFGVIIIFGGLAVFYILEDSRFTIRSAYFAIIGIGIAVEELILVIPFKIRRILNVIIISILTFAFSVSAIGIVDKYQNTSQADKKIVNQILMLDKEKFVTNVDRNTYLLGAVPYYKHIESVEWFESIRGACSGYADLTGCMRHLTGVSHTNNLTPIIDGEHVDMTIYMETSEICKFFALDEELNVIKVYLDKTDNNLQVMDEKNNIYGMFKSVENNEYIFEKH